MRFRSFAMAVALTALFGGSAVAGDITVSDAWVRASPMANGPAAIFLTITNGGSSPDRVVSAATPASRVTQLHSHTMADGVMRMRQVDGIDIPAGQSVELKPGAFHIMLLDPVAALKEGDSVPVTLTFEHAGAISATAHVAGAGAMQMPHMGGQVH